MHAFKISVGSFKTSSQHTILEIHENCEGGVHQKTISKNNKLKITPPLKYQILGYHNICSHITILKSFRKNDYVKYYLRAVKWGQMEL